MTETHAPGVDPAGVRHTPGPWLAASRASSVVGLPVVAQSGRSIASVTYFGLGDDFQRHNDECLANARLIAAAPDMFDTERKLAAEVGGLRAFEHEIRAVIGNTNWALLMQRLTEADAALAKSTGGSDEGR